MRKNLKGVNGEGYWYEPKNTLVGLEPVVDSTDRFGFKDPKGHLMMVYRVYLEPASRKDSDVGPCLHICFYCPECEAIGERRINMDGKVKLPCPPPEVDAAVADKLPTSDLGEAETKIIQSKTEVDPVKEHAEA